MVWFVYPELEFCFSVGMIPVPLSEGEKDVKVPTTPQASVSDGIAEPHHVDAAPDPTPGWQNYAAPAPLP
jgi:hypothetical protein